MPESLVSAGILPCQSIEALVANGAITAGVPFLADQVQPASLDLRLGARAWRVRASFLPGLGRKVAERIADVAMHELDLTVGAVLERGCVYIAQIAERLALPADVSARANPKSSTGRIDVFVRALTDHGAAFDNIAEGYAGPLYLEIAPQTFSVLARTGTRLNQVRLKRGELLLDPGEFYILASKDPIEIPVLEAAEMTPIDPAVGEFRVHYAGFFDPGFGAAETDSVGARGVLEVRSHETPFLLEDGQTVARLVYQPLTERPARLYGENGSHYQRQGLQLSKHFKAWR